MKAGGITKFTPESHSRNLLARRIELFIQTLSFLPMLLLSTASTSNETLMYNNFCAHFLILSRLSLSLQNLCTLVYEKKKLTTRMTTHACVRPKRRTSRKKDWRVIIEIRIMYFFEILHFFMKQIERSQRLQVER